MRYSELPHALDERRPLIYMWEIRGSEGEGELVGRYVGKAKAGARRPRSHYARNVANYLAGKPYRKNNPQGYRRVHLALAEAERRGFRITLQFLCNIESDQDINDVEQWHIRTQDCLGNEPWQLNG